MAETKLYHIPNIQHLVYESDSYQLKLENLPMNRFDTLISKGSNNTIDFSVRDKDRKPINLLDKTLTITIVQVANSELVSTKNLEILDYDKGFARLNLLGEELNDWDNGFYNYSVTVTEQNGREGFAFVDQVYRVTGQFELVGNAVGINSLTTTVTTFNTTTIGSQTYYVSGAFPFGVGTVHTAAAYFNNFLGTFEIQVTLDELIPTQEDNWATVVSDTLNAVTCVKDYTVIGNYNWIRFRYTESELNEGTLDQILYR